MATRVWRRCIDTEPSDRAQLRVGMDTPTAVQKGDDVPLLVRQQLSVHVTEG